MCTVKGYAAFTPTIGHVDLQDSNGIIEEIPSGISSGQYLSVSFQINHSVAFGLWCFLRFEEGGAQKTVNAFILPQYYG